jgi:DNA-binding NarL/FixJ family response regulator
LDTLARDRPVIAVLDDAHLADASSWEALRYLARHLAKARLCVVVTARTAELSHHEVAPQVLFELDRDGALTGLDVGPLERGPLGELTEELIGQHAPLALVDWLSDRSQGNALFAIGLLRALVEEGADLSAPRLQRLPESLAQRVVHRVTQLDEPQRSTLELLAVIGRRVEFAELTALCGRVTEDLGSVLSALSASGVVAEHEQGPELSYEIYHPLVRDAVYQSIGGARRRILHQELARVLQGGGRLPEAALHFARSARVGDEEAIGALLAAVRRAEQAEAYREALELLAPLAELLLPGDARWLDVSEAISWQAEWVIDHRADVQTQTAIRALRAIDGLLERSPDAARRAAVKVRLASFLAWGAGELVAAERICHEAEQLFTASGEKRESLLARREIAWVRGLGGDLAGMEADGRCVVKGAEALADRFVTMQGLVAIGWAATFSGRFDDAARALNRACGIAKADAKTYRLTAILVLLAMNRAREGRAEDALTLLREAKESNPAYRETVLLEGEAQIQWLVGNFPASVAAAREACARSPAGTSLRRTHGMAFGALSAAETGKVSEGRTFLARAQAVLKECEGWPRHQQVCRHAEAVLTWQEGRRLDALTMLSDTAARLRDIDAAADLSEVLLDISELAFETGDVDTAVTSAAETEELAARLDRDRHRAIAAISTAWARLASGDAQGAADRARSAVSLLSNRSCRALLGRALHVLGHSLAAGHRSEAVEALEQAAAVFHEAGATWRQDRILRGLRSLGSPGRRAAAAAAGAGSLTTREREVARLAVEGQSARQMAQRLHISERTIETHLTNIYAKLGVQSKVDLVRRAGELAF